jgi:hypothetical protein
MRCQAEGLAAQFRISCRNPSPRKQANSKSPAHYRPYIKRFMRWEGPLMRCGAMPTKLPGSWSYGHARHLRTRAPIAKPSLSLLTHRKLKALTSILHCTAAERIGLCRNRSYQGCKYGRRCRGNCKLAHCLLPQFANPPWIVFILHKNDI